MKTNAPKRQIFDAVDLLAGDDPAGAVCSSGIEMLDIDAIRPFKHHPFHLYEGERLDDMVESIKEHGILNPVIVRKMHFGYEMLSGHNRQNAGKLAGLTQIPAVVKENLSDAEAYVYVIETNLMQRSFTDMKISEKAAVLAERYDKVLYQRKKDEIIEELKALENFSEKGGHGDHLSGEPASGRSDHKLLNRENLGDEYGLSGSSVARLLRVNELIPEIKDLLDQGEMPLLAAVQLSYLPEKGQQLALEAAKESGIRINKTIAARIRNAPLTQQAIREAVTGVKKEEPYDPAAPCVVYKPIRLSADIREKYFPDTEMKEKDVERTIDKALAAWFRKRK